MVRNFNIRNRDELQTLAASLTLMANTFRFKHLALRESYHNLVNYLKERNFSVSSNDGHELQKMLDAINDELNYFKV